MKRVDNTDCAIVGGGLAGFNTAIAIRKHDSSSRILLVGDEPHLPYDRVPLSKDYLTGKRGRDRVFLRGKEFYDQQKIEVLTGRRATRLDTKGGALELAESAGLRVEKGIVVDEHLATEEDGVFAAKDVARFYSPSFYSPIFGRHLRVEHFDVATKHGMIGGANMTGRKLSFMELPFFYS